MSLERLDYDRESGTVTYTPDKTDGPTAGRHAFDAVEFIARLVAHIPDKGQVTQRYYGYYANRTRGERRKAAEAADCADPGAKGSRQHRAAPAWEGAGCAGRSVADGTRRGRRERRGGGLTPVTGRVYSGGV